MINGTNCNACGRFVYARKVPGHIDPLDYVCEDCRDGSIDAFEIRRNSF